MISINFYDAKLIIFFKTTKYFSDFFSKNIHSSSKSNFYIENNVIKNKIHMLINYIIKRRLLIESPFYFPQQINYPLFNHKNK